MHIYIYNTYYGMAPSRNTKPILSAKLKGFGVLSETVRKSWSGGFLSFMSSRFRASGFKIFSFEASRFRDSSTS